MIAWIGLGGNLGDVRDTLEQACIRLNHGPCRVQAVSGLYGSKPLGEPDQPDYLNAVLRLATALGPLELLELLKRTEVELGRVTRGRWRERELDLDLLLVCEDGSLMVESAVLRVPHPGMRERAFVLEPLLELNGELVDPRDGHRFNDDIEGLRARDAAAVRLMEGRGWCRIS